MIENRPSKQDRTTAASTGSLAMLLIVFAASASFGSEPDPDLKPIGGRWFVKEANRPIYYFKDGERFVDLFSYHVKDSNKDGIDNIQLSYDSQFLIMKSQGYPNHPTAIFPNSDNPNSIRVQQFTFRLPLEPKLADHITRVPMGPIGTALNGVVFFNPFEAGGMNAVEGYSEVWLDSCCGHPAPGGVYHYHKYPSCVKSPFADDGKQHSPVIGFAFDGFPVYGPYEESGLMAKDLKAGSGRALDVCNGHRDDSRGYHYHVTPGRFPYILGGYVGVVEHSNNHELRRVGLGPIQNNAKPGTSLPVAIISVRPGTASRGKTHEIRIELAPGRLQKGNAIPAAKPSWVQIGPYEAKTISREGQVVTAEIEIPDDATPGVLLDCHLEFALTDGSRPIVFKKNEAFRVVD